MIKAVSKDFRIQPFRYNKTDKELLRIINFCVGYTFLYERKVCRFTFIITYCNGFFAIVNGIHFILNPCSLPSLYPGTSNKGKDT